MKTGMTITRPTAQYFDGRLSGDGKTSVSVVPAQNFALLTVASEMEKNLKRTQSIRATKPDVTMKGKNVEGNLKGDATS